MRVSLMVVVLATSMFLSACASPYSTPEVDQLGSSGPLAFNGIADHLKQGDTRVIWIHGMCVHGYDWANEKRDALYKAIGATPASGATGRRDDSPETAPYPVNDTAFVGRSKLDTSFLVWSPISTPFKDRLRYDDSPDAGEDRKDRFPYQRASLNRSLKQTLINRCLIDAVVYAGPNGDDIRRWVKAQVCEGLGGRNEPKRCDLGLAGPPPRTVLVAESLGSKVLFDALRSIGTDNEGSSRAAEQLASVQSVFLLANQIPLLDAADGPPTDIKAFGADEAGDMGFLSVLTEARASRLKTAAAAAPLPELQVVAFTDPNDLLSYRLSGKGLHYERVKVINVIVSNAPTYLGLFEMPDAAHCGYKWNRYVVGAVAFGYHGGITPVGYSLPEKCGLLGGKDKESATQ